MEESTKPWWRKYLLIVVGIALIVLLVVLFWHLFVSKSPKVSDCNAKLTTSQCKSTASQKKSQTSNAQTKSKSSSATTPSTPTSTSNSSVSTSNSSTPQQLTNTGPGNVVAVFIGTMIIASLGHYIYSRRRTNTTRN